MSSEYAACHLLVYSPFSVDEQRLPDCGMSGPPVAKRVSVVISVQSIRSLPESDDPVLGVLPSKTVIARDNLLAHDRPVSGDPVDDDDDDDIWKPARVLGPNVFKNAAPFLRVCDVHSGLQGSDIFSVKDNMRVHPQDEAALVELACIAVDIKSTDTEEREGAVMRAAIYPEKVCHALFLHLALSLSCCHPHRLRRTEGPPFEHAKSLLCGLFTAGGPALCLQPAEGVLCCLALTLLLPVWRSQQPAEGSLVCSLSTGTPLHDLVIRGKWAICLASAHRIPCRTTATLPGRNVSRTKRHEQVSFSS